MSDKPVVQMRALTVQQPWAWAIVHGGKDVENRTQAWSYRGPLAIHAGARVSDRGMESPLVLNAARQLDPETPAAIQAFRRGWRRGPAAASGAIIGVVELVDVHSADWCWEPDGLCSAWAESEYVEHGGDLRDRIVHLVLGNPRPLAEPIPAKGRLGLWTPDAELLDRIREQVPA